MILQEKIEINELVFINKPLYNSLENMTNMECSDLGLSYNIEFKDYKNNYHSFDIIKNGINIPVRDMKDFIN